MKNVWKINKNKKIIEIQKNQMKYHGVIFFEYFIRCLVNNHPQIFKRGAVN